MESLIIIENENLANYLMFKLDKMNNGFTDDELNKITEMVIDYDLEDDSSFKFLEELRWLKNLRMIVLRNGYIYNDNYNIFLNFNNLEEFVFDNCSFENASLMASLKLKSLSLINCKIEDYTFISVFDLLEELTIINGVVEMERVNKLDNLRYLQLSYSNIIDGDYLQIDRLEELYIDNTNIRDFNFLDGLLNLKELIIDKEQYDSNRELFNKIRERNILVMDNNMVLLGDDGNGI